MINLCRKAGLDVSRESLFDFLERADGYGGLFISHVIEHLDGEDAERMIRLGYKSLKDGGRIVLITPNPENISVMTGAFWLDLTHVRPYPLMLLEEMLKDCGFKIVSSGGAFGTFGNIRLKPFRRFLAKIALPPLGLAPYWKYLHTAQDIYVVAEKRVRPD